MKNLTAFRKTVETGVDPHLLGYVYTIPDSLRMRRDENHTR